MTRDFERELVLLFRAGTVENLDRVDHGEDFQRGGALRMRYVDRLAIGIDKRKSRVELVAKRMVRNQEPAGIVDHPTQFLEPVDSADVALESKRADMPQVGCYLHPAQKDHPFAAA